VKSKEQLLQAFVLAAFIAVCCDAANSDLPAPVEIDYFYEAGCPECIRVRERILPDLKAKFDGLYTLRMYNIAVESNVVRMLAFREKLHVVGNKPVWMVVDYTHILNGYSRIEDGLFDCVNEAIAVRLDPEWKPPEPIEVDFSKAVMGAMKNLAGIGVVAAGLSDGINPCAIGVLVFFISVLSVSGLRGRQLLFAGIPFCLGSFAAYFLLGLGLLHVLRMWAGIDLLYRGMEWAMAALLVVLAVLSFKDAWAYVRTGRESALTLKLGDWLRNRIHRLIRDGVRAGRIVPAAFVLGALVTLLEAPCTGQAYLPALVLMIRNSISVGSALGWLVLYNLLFIVPLFVVFGLVYFGTGTERLVGWSRRNVPIAKILLGAVFLLLAVLLAI